MSQKRFWFIVVALVCLAGFIGVAVPVLLPGGGGETRPEKTIETTEVTVMVEKVSASPGNAQYLVSATGEPVALGSIRVLVDGKPLTSAEVLVNGAGEAGSWDAEGVFTFERAPVIFPERPVQLAVTASVKSQLLLARTARANAVGMLSGGLLRVPAVNQ